MEGGRSRRLAYDAAFHAPRPPVGEGTDRGSPITTNVGLDHRSDVSRSAEGVLAAAVIRARTKDLALQDANLQLANAGFWTRETPFQGNKA